MATSNYLRRQRRRGIVTSRKGTITAPKSIFEEMNIGEKSSYAHKLVKEGKAADLKAAWEIIKQG